MLIILEINSTCYVKGFPAYGEIIQLILRLKGTKFYTVGRSLYIIEYSTQEISNDFPVISRIEIPY